MPAEDTILEGAVTAIQAFAAEYTPQVIVVLGITILIGLGIWGFVRLVGLFRKTAK